MVTRVENWRMVQEMITQVMVTQVTVPGDHHWKDDAFGVFCHDHCVFASSISTSNLFIGTRPSCFTWLQNILNTVSASLAQKCQKATRSLLPFQLLECQIGGGFI